MEAEAEGAEGMEEVREAIRRSRGVVVLTGAGVSAESGVATFRDRDGLWSRYDPQELATPEAFARDPRKVWEWYDLRRRAVLECAPNPGHRAIARLLRTRDDATLVTQNVDGLHQRAVDDEMDEGPGGAPEGTPPPGHQLLELHGNLLRTRCSGCGEGRWNPDPVDTSSPEALPRCAPCGGLLRPDVVWFGEMLDLRTLETAFERAREAEICVVAGTSAVVHPAASVPLATLEGGGSLVEVNPDATPLTRLSRWSLRGPSGRILPLLLGP
jgi:NAD-dependent deacetylase